MQQTELQQGLQALQDKLKHLLDKHSSLQKENMKLAAEKEKLQQQLAAKEDAIKILQQENDVLKSGIQKWHPEQRKLFAKRIDLYLREIEKCIAMINE